jgi:flagellar basal-body rod protein FlgF
MGDLLGILRLGLDAGRQRLEAIGLNASNAARPGYRRAFALDAVTLDAPAGRPVALAAEVPAAAAAARAGGAAPGPQAAPAARIGHGDLDLRATERAVDLRPGEPIATGRALDLAIEGDDLFFALTDGVRTWLTRAGAFRLDADGVLVGENGLRVVGRDGEVRLAAEDVDIQRDGQVLHEGVAVAALQLFRPAERAALRAAGGTLLSAAGGVLAAEPGAGRLRSGFLEASNADAARDLVELVALTRQFESLARVGQGYDELLGRAIAQFGGA